MILQESKNQLLKEAAFVRKFAYCPYSKYQVGAAVLTKNGRIFTGVNVENSSYGVCICGERSAVFNAISSGHREIEAIAIATRDGGTPCGACRQVLNEFNPNMLVLLCDENGKLIKEYALTQLLPEGFGPRN